jgi:hypothetical protein
VTDIAKFMPMETIARPLAVFIHCFAETSRVLQFNILQLSSTLNIFFKMGQGGYRQINKALNICAFEDYLSAQQAGLPELQDVEQVSPRVLRILGQNAGQVRGCTTAPPTTLAGGERAMTFRC